jgi:DNA-binding NarL/FixJ family response regulator
MKLRLDKYLFLSIHSDSFGLLTHKLRQAETLYRFKVAHQTYFEKLTVREIEVLALLAEGNDNAAVASQLNISRRTVENHRKSINQKLQVNHLRDVIKFALAFGLTPFKR